MTVITDINQLKADQEHARRSAIKIREKAEREGKDLTQEQLNQINAHLDEWEEIGKRAATLERMEGIHPTQKAMEDLDTAPVAEDRDTVPMDSRNGRRDENDEWREVDNGTDPYSARWDDSSYRFRDMSIRQARNFVNAAAAEEYNEAFYSYLREKDVSPEQARELFKVRTMVEGTDADGGYLAPTQLVAGIVYDAQEYEQLKPRMDVIRANVRSLTYTKGLDSIVMGWVAELGTKPEDQLSFGTTTLVPHVGAVVVWVSDELLEDETYGLQGYLQTRVGEGKVLLEEEAFISGSGTGRPFGILTRLNAEGGTPNRVTWSLAGSIPAAVREMPYNQVSPIRRRRSVWILGRNAIKYIITLRDGSGGANTGQFMWQPSLQAGEPATLDGYPVLETSATGLSGTFTAGNDVGIFGDLREYRVLERLGLQVKRLEELRALTDEVGFRFRFRTGGDVVLNSAFKTIRIAA